MNTHVNTNVRVCTGANAIANHPKPKSNPLGRPARALAPVAPLMMTIMAMTMIVALWGGAAEVAAQIILVSKTDEDAQFKTIQAAVNFVGTNKISDAIIEIMDSETYGEQVTIDGRDDNNHWTGVRGNIKTLTLRAAKGQRPTIKHQDIDNRSPLTNAEAKKAGDQKGTSGNFETCGALRIIRAYGITIEGIIVDGGGSAPFKNDGVWGDGPTYPLVHGNAAIAVAVSGNVQIRNCELKNAYFGIAVKDRNTGGSFGNPNPADNDFVIANSGFGKTGFHLFEYNSIHTNDVGIYFESSWDMGSSVRYNLIYSNYNQGKSPKPASVDMDWSGGGIRFKDNYLSPVAIYNNTFWNNEMAVNGGWQIGGQHLLFNNIFGKNYPQNTFAQTQGNILGKFPNRMYSCVIAADQEIQEGTITNEPNCTGANALKFVQGVQFRGFTNPTQEMLTFTQCASPNYTPTQQGVRPGALIPGTSQPATTFPTGANNRWLEMAGFTKGQLSGPLLFKSITPGASGFLEPDWDKQEVKDFIEAKGWTGSGIVNEAGATPDLGAIQKNPVCKRPGDNKTQITRGRVLPTSVVTINGTTATGRVFISEEVSGGLNNSLNIKQRYHWISPLEDNKDKSGDGFTVIPSSSINAVTPIPTKKFSFGPNTLDPWTASSNDVGGFLEVVFSDGKYSTDIGFLPFRKLEYQFKIEAFLPGSSTAIALETAGLNAGQTYQLKITVTGNNGQAKSAYDTPAGVSVIDSTSISLSSGALITCDGATCGEIAKQNDWLERDGTSAKPVPFVVTYNVHFENAGLDVIQVAGSYIYPKNAEKKDQKGIAIFGTQNVKINPGDPAKLTFIDPYSKSFFTNTSQLPVINRGQPYPVQVEVQDKYGNAVDRAFDIAISITDRYRAGANTPITDCDVATVTPPTVKTNTSGLAIFTANTVGCANSMDAFDMKATYGSFSDVGGLRVGKMVDKFQIFYDDANLALPDPDVAINAMMGEWKKVTVKVIQPDGTVLPGRGVTSVTIAGSNPNLRFSLTEGAAGVAGPFDVPVTAGLAVFWVSAADGSPDISDACVEATGMVGADNRCSIYFKKAKSNIDKAIVFGDGYGRPDSLLIYYGNDGTSAGGFNGSWPLPDSVYLKWPTGAVDRDAVVEVGVGQGKMYKIGDFILGVSLRGAVDGIARQLPTGYTNVSGSTGIIRVKGGAMGADAEDSPPKVLDGMGPVLSANSDNRSGYVNPRIVENVNPGVNPDTLNLYISEVINEDNLVGGSLQTVKSAGDPNGTAPAGVRVLNVGFAGRAGSIYRAVLAGGVTPPDVGDWVRFVPGPAGSVEDGASSAGDADYPGNNKAHVDNRWVQVELQETPPAIVDGGSYFTSSVTTGALDYAYVKFNKPVNVGTWFSGGYVKIEKDSTSVNNSGAFLEASPTDPNMLKIKLDTAYASEVYQDVANKSDVTKKVRTSRSFVITLGYNPANSWGVNGKDDVTFLADSAKPVIADSVAGSTRHRAVFLRPGGVCANCMKGFADDTLDVFYSEPGNYNHATPIVIQKSGGGTVIPTLTFLSERIAGGNYQLIRYLVSDYNGDWSAEKFGGTDSVYINPAALITDKPAGNVQDESINRKVQLRVVNRTNWVVRLNNNPSTNDGGRDLKVTIDPGLRSADQIEDLKARIFVYDNLGNLVVDESIVRAGSDKTNIEWTWNDGRNKKGRIVGTGTYLFKAVCEVKIRDGASSPDNRHIEKRPIGFVRKKT